LLLRDGPDFWQQTYVIGKSSKIWQSLPGKYSTSMNLLILTCLMNIKICFYSRKIGKQLVWRSNTAIPATFQEKKWVVTLANPYPNAWSCAKAFRTARISHILILALKCVG